ncbi:MAG: hypothetical protein GC179_12590 [Anaerolineaceae bacterium]|nr:hypothetical protein [Anaerolineaceae bacterium]
MPEQSKPEKLAVVGEDGELIQSDTTVNPDVYTEFVATYVRHDPLLFRIRLYVREHRYISSILIFFGLCMASKLVEDLFSNPAQLGDDVRSIILLILGVGIFIGIFAKIVHMILQIDIRQ